MQDKKTISIAIIDPSSVTRKGFSAYLKNVGAFEIIAEFESGKDVLPHLRTLNPDVVLMEITLPDMMGSDLVQMIKTECKNTKVIVTNSDVKEERLFAALKAGADAYCLKNISSERLLETIHSVCEGGAWLDPPLARKVFSLFPSVLTVENNPGLDGTRRNPQEIYGLSTREHEVLSLIVAGKNNNEIAGQLNISYHTVKSDVTGLLQKLGVQDRTQAAVKALKESLV